MATLAAILKDLAYLCGAVELEGTATSGSTTTLVDTVRASGYSDDTFNGRRLYIWVGTGVGQERRVTDFTGSTSTFTFGTGTAPSTDSQWILLKENWTVGQLRQAFINSLLQRREYYMLPKVDESLTLAVTAGVPTYAYTVPSGFATISRIVREDNVSGSDFLTPIPMDAWYINRAATKQIVFEKVANDHWQFIVNGLKLRIVGQQYETEPSADSSSLTIPHAALNLLAASKALQVMRTTDNTNSRGYSGMANLLYQEWLVARGGDETQPDPNCRWVDKGA